MFHTLRRPKREAYRRCPSVVEMINVWALRAVRLPGAVLGHRDNFTNAVLRGNEMKCAQPVRACTSVAKLAIILNWRYSLAVLDSCCLFWMSMNSNLTARMMIMTGFVYLLYMFCFKMSCVYCCRCLVCTVVILCAFVVLCVYCYFYFRCRTAG